MVIAVTGSTLNSEIAPAVSSFRFPYHLDPRFSAVGRTGSINLCARPGAAVYEAKLSSPQRWLQDRLTRRLPSLPCLCRAVLLMLSRLSHAASS